MEDKTIKVKCKTNEFNFIKGKIYIAKRTMTGAYKLINNKGMEHLLFAADFFTLFEKVEDVLMVECVENKKYVYDNITIGKKYKVLGETGLAYEITNNYGERAYYQKDCFKSVEPQKETKKNFREVIADIKEGEEWKAGTTIISMKDNKIKIKDIECDSLESYTYNEDHREFIKAEEPKPVTTTEAFKALDEGKIIESVISKDKYKKINGIIHIEKEDGDTGRLMYIYRNELEGQWIIIE